MTILRVQSCQRCKYVQRVMQPEQGFECRRFPPQVQMMAVPAGPGRMAMQMHSTFPRVTGDLHCGEWAPGLARADDNVIDLPVPIEGTLNAA